MDRLKGKAALVTGIGAGIGTYIYPNEYAETILKWMQEIHTKVSDTVEIVAVGQSLPSEAISATNLLGGFIPVIIVHVLAFEDSLENGIESLLPFETCPVLDKAFVSRTNYLTTFEEEAALQLIANPEENRWVVHQHCQYERIHRMVSRAFRF